MENVDLEILDRLKINSKNICFISLKDHKENFLNNPVVLMVNPVKNEFRKTSKAILGKINSRVFPMINIIHWKNAASKIGWFK